MMNQNSKSYPWEWPTLISIFTILILKGILFLDPESLMLVFSLVFIVALFTKIMGLISEMLIERQKDVREKLTNLLDFYTTKHRNAGYFYSEYLPKFEQFQYFQYKVLENTFKAIQTKYVVKEYLTPLNLQILQTHYTDRKSPKLKFESKTKSIASATYNIYRYL